DVKERAYKAAMQNDLRNLVTAQEIYFDQNDKYAQTPDEAGLALSKGVTIVISSNSNYLSGYTAEASHRGTEVTCTLRNEHTDQGSRIKCSDEPDDTEN